jgi:hypothetical protein
LKHDWHRVTQPITSRHVAIEILQDVLQGHAASWLWQRILKNFVKLCQQYINYVKAIAKVVKSATPFQQKEDMKLA